MKIVDRVIENPIEQLEIQYNINGAGFTELKLPQHLERAQNEIARLNI
jgi:hypothetical protein